MRDASARQFLLALDIHIQVDLDWKNKSTIFAFN